MATGYTGRGTAKVVKDCMYRRVPKRGIDTLTKSTDGGSRCRSERYIPMIPVRNSRPKQLPSARITPISDSYNSVIGEIRRRR
jgi:hypothetical protein